MRVWYQKLYFISEGPARMFLKIGYLVHLQIHYFPMICCCCNSEFVLGELEGGLHLYGHTVNLTFVILCVPQV